MLKGSQLKKKSCQLLIYPIVDTNFSVHLSVPLFICLSIHFAFATPPLDSKNLWNIGFGHKKSPSNIVTSPAKELEDSSQRRPYIYFFVLVYKSFIDYLILNP